MIFLRLSRLGATVLLLAGWAVALQGQGIAFDAGRFISNPDLSVYRLSYTHLFLGPLGGSVLGSYQRARADKLSREFYSLGAGVTLFQGGSPGPYLSGVFEAGISAGDSEAAWTSWSAGGGWEFIPLDFVALAGELRYQSMSPPDLRGVELGARLRIFWSSGGPPAQPAYSSSTPPPSAPASPEIRRDLAASGASTATVDVLAGVVATATSVMGTPYVWGGSGEADGGFDCSGLIQYAYASQGISLPRVSRDQARAGEPVSKSLDALRPGDILTFSTKGGPVTHVGLYLGDGQFIHSASRGVTVSQLGEADPYGRWWYRRWVGARRVVQ